MTEAQSQTTEEPGLVLWKPFKAYKAWHLRYWPYLMLSLPFLSFTLGVWLSEGWNRAEKFGMWALVLGGWGVAWLLLTINRVQVRHNSGCRCSRCW